MSEDAENTTTWQTDRRLRYLVPVIVVLGLILFILAVAASCGSRDNRRGLKPFRSTRVPIGNDASGAVAILSFSELNNAPDVYKNQRIRVTGDKMTILPQSCRLYTGPVFVWGLISEDLQLHALGYEAVVKRLPDGLTMTVEGIWRQYDGPLGCGKEPADGQAWYLQVERIISPNPLPLIDGGPFATIQVPLGAQNGVDITPLGTPQSETAVPGQPGIGITPLSTATPLPGITQPAPATATTFPTSTTNSGLATATRPFPGLTPSPTPLPGATATESDPASGGTDPTATPSLTPMPTVPGLTTQTPAPTVPGGYPGTNPSTPVPTVDPYS
jgi:hypothetical protein